MDAPCASISSTTGCTILCVKELRYPSVHILQSRTFTCSLSNHRKAFYRSANAIFGKIGSAGGRHNMPLPLQFDLWHFDIESGVRVTWRGLPLCQFLSS